MCPRSYALGSWRGYHRKARVVRLDASICVTSYEEGFEAGRHERSVHATVRRIMAGG